jgi:inorganic pyrophosphatase
VDTIRVHPHDHDDSEALDAHYSCLERLRPHGCYEGVVYIGHLVVGDDGEEAEVVEAVPCRRCAEGPAEAKASR